MTQTHSNISARHSIKNGLAITGACIFLQGLFFLICFFSKVGGPFVSPAPNQWTYDLSSLKNGFYFLSLGRPLAGCDIFADGRLLESNKSEEPEIRKSLMLGTSIFISDQDFPKNHPKTLSIRCDTQLGFDATLSIPPLLTHYEIGQLLALWQCIIHLVLGPTISILLMFLIFTYSQLKNKVSDSKKEKLYFNTVDQPLGYFKYALFSTSALAYTVSLTQFPRMFIDPLDASELHMILRNFFTFTFLILFGFGIKRLIFFGHLHAILIFLTVLFARYHEPFLPFFYHLQGSIFIAEAVYLIYYVFRSKANLISIQLLSFLAVTWLILQCLDPFSFSDLHLADHLSPILIFVIIFRIGFSYFNERTTTERFAIASSRILEVIEGQDRIEDILVKIAKIVFTETRFVRVSAYLDAYCVGRAGKPRQKLMRVFEAGYTKDTAQDNEILNERERGVWMFESLQNGTLQLRKNAVSGAHFIIVPIGRHACINLSNPSVQEAYFAFESENLIRRLLPALRALDSKLISLGTQLGTNINQLRSVLGDGEVLRNIGVLVADVNDYSQLTARFGEAFSAFVRGTFFSLLIKTVNQWSILQSITGDEISLISIPEFLQDGMDPKVAIMKTAHEIHQFQNTIGKHLCEEQGYPVIQMSAGMSFGSATIHCDPYQVSVTGLPMIESSRILHAAAQNQILVKSSVTQDGSTYPGLSFGEEFVIRNKKNVISVRPLIVKSDG